MKTSLEPAELEAALQEEPFAASDRQLRLYLSRAFGEQNTWIQLLAALLARAAREGNSCLDLHDSHALAGTALANSHRWPTPDFWQGWLKQSAAVGSPAQAKPLLIETKRFAYLHKYYDHEDRLAKAIQKLTQRAPNHPQGRLRVITGGPGTGKTTTVLGLLADYLSSLQRPAQARLATCAPTGKAAARLAESIRLGLQRLDVDPPIKELLQQIPSLTLHRLLGARGHSASFRHDSTHTLDLDVLVIDEASMIDLPLMRRALEALPDYCRLFLLGDKDQLSSVEVGSVFGDLLQAASQPGSPLAPAVTTLAKTYRFRADSSIFRACAATREGDSDALLQLIEEGAQSDFEFRQLLKQREPRLPASYLRAEMEAFRQRLGRASSAEALSSLDQRITLCPTRRGPLGSERINLELQLALAPNGHASAPDPYHGLPIIVLENDYQAELFNGDLGILWQNPDSGQLDAWFPASDNEARRVRLAHLPRHELAFALTIHKSQGSEFDQVTCLFPPQDSSFITRELVYTAFSRARQKIVLYAQPEALARAAQRPVQRATRLAAKLAP